MSSPQPDSPEVTFRSPSRPTGSFLQHSDLPAALAVLNPLEMSSPSEMTILANKLKAVRLTSPTAADVTSRLNFGEDEKNLSATKSPARTARRSPLAALQPSSVDRGTPTRGAKMMASPQVKDGEALIDVFASPSALGRLDLESPGPSPAPPMLLSPSESELSVRTGSAELQRVGKVEEDAPPNLIASEQSDDDFPADQSDSDSISDTETDDQTFHSAISSRTKALHQIDGFTGKKLCDSFADKSESECEAKTLAPAESSVVHVQSAPMGTLLVESGSGSCTFPMTNETKTKSVADLPTHLESELLEHPDNTAKAGLTNGKTPSPQSYPEEVLDCSTNVFESREPDVKHFASDRTTTPICDETLLSVRTEDPDRSTVSETVTEKAMLSSNEENSDNVDSSDESFLHARNSSIAEATTDEAVPSLQSSSQDAMHTETTECAGSPRSSESQVAEKGCVAIDLASEPLAGRSLIKKNAVPSRETVEDHSSTHGLPESPNQTSNVHNSDDGLKLFEDGLSSDALESSSPPFVVDSEALSVSGDPEESVREAATQTSSVSDAGDDQSTKHIRKNSGPCDAEAASGNSLNLAEELEVTKNEEARSDLQEKSLEDKTAEEQLQCNLGLAPSSDVPEVGSFTDSTNTLEGEKDTVRTTSGELVLTSRTIDQADSTLATSNHSEALAPSFKQIDSSLGIKESHQPLSVTESCANDTIELDGSSTHIRPSVRIHDGEFSGHSAILGTSKLIDSASCDDQVQVTDISENTLTIAATSDCIQNITDAELQAQATDSFESIKISESPRRDTEKDALETETSYHVLSESEKVLHAEGTESCCENVPTASPVSPSSSIADRGESMRLPVVNESPVTEEPRNRNEKFSDSPTADVVESVSNAASAREVGDPEELPEYKVLRGHCENLSTELSSANWRELTVHMDYICSALGSQQVSDPSQSGSESDLPKFFATYRESLARAVDRNVSAIRPSISISSYNLLTALLLSKVIVPIDLSPKTFTTALETASGPSRAAKAAAKSVTTMISFSPDSFKHELRRALVAEKVRLACERAGEDGSDDIASVRNAAGALAAVRLLMEQGSSVEEEETPAMTSSERKSGDTRRSSPGLPQSSPQRENSKVSTPIPSRDSRAHFSPDVRTPRRFADGEIAPSSSSTPTQGISTPLASPSLSVRFDAGLRESRLSARKITPASMRKKRLYTEDELDEARRVALRQAMEEANSLYADERLRSDARVNKLMEDKKLLETALCQFEATINEMIARENSSTSAASAQHELENSTLKGELLETTEAFDALRKRYEDVKQELNSSKIKEERMSENIRTLKTSMVDLQTWSNQLKANTEKKLKASFETATMFEARFREKEAHEARAAGELASCQNELQGREQMLRETMAKVSQLENQLTEARDTGESQLKAKENLQQEHTKVCKELSAVSASLTSLQDRIPDLEARAEKYTAADIALQNSLERQEFLTKENKNLKARAYDDMTRLRKLELEMNEKTDVVEELQRMCEELMEKVEKKQGLC